MNAPFTSPTTTPAYLKLKAALIERASCDQATEDAALRKMLAASEGEYLPPYPEDGELSETCLISDAKRALQRLARIEEILSDPNRTPMAHGDLLPDSMTIDDVAPGVVGYLVSFLEDTIVHKIERGDAGYGDDELLRRRPVEVVKVDRLGNRGIVSAIHVRDEATGDVVRCGKGRGMDKYSLRQFSTATMHEQRHYDAAVLAHVTHFVKSTKRTQLTTSTSFRLRLGSRT